jgi:DNA repair protein RecO (recombination protein O)
MQVKTKAIVISSIKYTKEKSLIVKVFYFVSRFKSYFVRNAFAGRKSNQKIAYFQYLRFWKSKQSIKQGGAGAF